MTLRPCPSCRRHVREDQCPFCGASLPPAVRLPAVAGRFSRAAVFAGATLAGCSSSPAPQHAAPPPPPDDHAAVIVDAAPPADAAVQTFAAPPPDAAAPAVGTSIIRGTIRYTNAQPYAHRAVTLVGVGGSMRGVRTDAKGRYEIRDIPAGTYQVRLERDETNRGHQGPPPPPTRAVVLADNQTETVDFTIAVYVEPVEHDRGPCCKPYGAPPARRRVV
jgi:hypothetical protein